MIEKFLLNLNDKYKIEIFSLAHLLLIITTLIIIFFIVKNKNKIQSLTIKKKIGIRYLLAIILIINLLIRRGSFIYYGVYDWHIHLDINFCNFTSIMFLFYSLSGNKKIYSICFYLAFVGPLMAILFPSVNISPFNYSFYSYLIIHHVIFIFNFLFLFMEDLQYNKQDFLKVLLFLFIYFTIIFIFNYYFNTAYNMVASLMNTKLELNSVLIGICNNSLASNFLFYTFVIMLLFLAKKILSILNNKK